MPSLNLPPSLQRALHRFERNIWFSAALLLMLVCLATWVTARNFIDQREYEVERSATDLADALRLQTEQTLAVVDTTLKVLTRSLQNRLHDPAQVRQILRQGNPDLPGFMSLLVLDADGRSVASSLPDFVPGDSFADRDYFRVHAQQDSSPLYVGGPLRSRSHNKLFFPLSHRLEDKQGRFIGVLMASMEVPYLARIFDRFRQGEHGAIALAHIPSRQIVVRSPDHERHFAQDVSRSPLFSGLLAEEKGIYEVDTATDGIVRKIAYHQLHTAPMVMLVGYARADLEAEYRPVLLQYALAALLFSLLILGLAWQLIRGQRRRLHAEQQRAASQERLQLAADAAGIGVWEHNLDTGELLWDERMYQIYAGDPDSDPRALFRARIAPEDQQYIHDMLRKLISSGEAQEVDFRIILPDGGVRHVHSLARLRRDPTRQLLRIVGVNLDVSDSRLAQAELEQHRRHLETLVTERTAELSLAKEAAEAANVAKSSFIANMSHELRTPLHAITGMSELIRRSGLNDKQQGRLDKLDSAAEHLLEVINSILELAKIEAGKLELVYSRIGLTGLLTETLDMLQAKAGAKGLTLRAAPLPPCAPLLGDATCLRQALLNYLANAIKFTERGQIEVAVSIENEDENSCLLRFSVRDTGIGVDHETLTRLFTAFEQADNSSSRKYGGTGLGLAITARLAQLMEGRAGAESQPGQGSCFWFTARLRKAANASG
ncbi:ATP-binding protein [Dechloromonas sp. ZY10]|uniref:sensor histidine kinase n=1 Tax=Dechloromonas aquae TaxID=2664436 RepID=UPI0035294248